MDGQRARSGIFPDLAAARTKSVEAMNRWSTPARSSWGKIRAIIDPILTPEERKKLDAARHRARRLQRQLSNLPTTDEGIKHARARDEGPASRDLDRQALGAQRRDPVAGGAAGGHREVLPSLALRAEDPARGHPGAGARHARRHRRAARHARQDARGDCRRQPRGHRGGRRRARRSATRRRS